MHGADDAGYVVFSSKTCGLMRSLGLEVWPSGCVLSSKLSS